MDNQSLKPSFINLPSLVADKEAEKKGATDEERILYGGSKTAFWGVLKGIFEDAEKDLDNLNSVAIEKGAPFEEIGKNTVVVNLAKGIITRIKNKVEDAVEACEKPNGTKE
jgi:hypothetical protein